MLLRLNIPINLNWGALGASEEGCGAIADIAKDYVFGAESNEYTIALYLQAARCYLLINHIDDAKKILVHWKVV